MAVFGHLSFKHFHTLLQHLNLPIQIFCVRLQALNCPHGLFKRFLYGLLLLLKLENLLVFFERDLPPDCSLRSELVQFFL